MSGYNGAVGSVVGIVRRVGLAACLLPAVMVTGGLLTENFANLKPSAVVLLSMTWAACLLAAAVWRWVAGVRWDGVQSLFALLGVVALTSFLVSAGQERERREQIAVEQQARRATEQYKLVAAEQQRQCDSGVYQKGSLTVDEFYACILDGAQPVTQKPQPQSTDGFPPIPTVHSEHAMDAWNEECLEVKSGSECWRERGRLSKLPR
jgi:type II secretory pathway pseudopilin PulG